MSVVTFDNVKILIIVVFIFAYAHFIACYLFGYNHLMEKRTYCWYDSCFNLTKLPKKQQQQKHTHVKLIRIRSCGSN